MVVDPGQLVIHSVKRSVRYFFLCKSKSIKNKTTDLNRKTIISWMKIILQSDQPIISTRYTCLSDFFS